MPYLQTFPGGGAEPADNQATVGIDGDLLAGGDCQHRLPRAGDQRDAERPGHDRGVSSAGAACQHDADHLLGPGGHIARAEIVGHND